MVTKQEFDIWALLIFFRSMALMFMKLFIYGFHYNLLIFCVLLSSKSVLGTNPHQINGIIKHFLYYFEIIPQ